MLAQQLLQQHQPLGQLLVETAASERKLASRQAGHLLQPMCMAPTIRRSQMLASRHLQVEHILTLVAQIFALEVVLVCLCAHERVYIRNARGFAAGDFPFRWGFCGWGIATDNPECLVIEDARQDARSAAF